MSPAGETFPRPRVAIAEPVNHDRVSAILAGKQIFDDGAGAEADLSFGRSPEDFQHGNRYQLCLIPQESSREWLGALVRLNCNYFIESFDQIDLRDLGPIRTAQRGAKWDLLVCMSTQSAYQLPMARKFVTALRHRGIIHDTIAPTVEMAVQEAFANSLVHGNLELDTTGHLTMDRFNALGEETARRLEAPAYGGRVIMLTAKKRRNGNVEISINDQGNGFTPPPEKPAPKLPGSESTFGRGLPLIRSLCQNVSFERGGRTIKLTFTPDTKASMPLNSNFAAGVEEAEKAIGESDLRNPRDATILIADDTMISREIIASYLRSDGFTNLVFAKDGEDALEQVRKHNPDLIILDIIMPKMDGYAVCKALRADPAYAETPIIAQTALEENEGRTRIFEDGATDLILKPLNKAELIARTRIHLENRLLVKQLQAYQERTQSELELARDMQEMLIPKPEQYRGIGMDYGMTISASFQMSSELGGDMWGLAPIDKDRLGVYIVDFAGHGLGAALNTFRLHSLIWSEEDRGEDPGTYLEALNRHLKGLLPVGQYATMLYGVIDRAKETFRYASAACTSPVLGNVKTGSTVFLDGSGVPLGVIRDAQYETRELTFTTDNFLLLYSDALIETVLDDGVFLEDDRLLKMVHNIVTETNGSTDLASNLADQFMDRAPVKLHDDFTVVSLQSADISGPKAS
ncbi:SpoIIE family protein phosphatase [Thalassospira alkalitolerans]|uniref:SpoIIE family protein phosphatase n=1 Tax=Thalassospira alkalitolerans TaxID=1293890 RepID=UPI0030ECDDDC|tara:strand:- start:91 stop:2160 length:2070 start_codon:yes stop_codon:yes gene_type:complete